jgi:hypothetical protein
VSSVGGSSLGGAALRIVCTRTAAAGGEGEGKQAGEEGSRSLGAGSGCDGGTLVALDWLHGVATLCGLPTPAGMFARA